MKDERCIFIILPDVTNNFKDEEVLEKLEEKNFIILKKKKVHLTENEIKEILNEKPEQYSNIGEFYAYVESGLSVISLVEHIEGNTAERLNSLVKSTSILIKDEKYFECLEYQCNLKCKNAPFYFSKNDWYFSRDLNYFFPPRDDNFLERTLIILKPDVIDQNKIGDIVNEILNFGLLIVAMKRGILSAERARSLYEGSAGKPYYDALIEFMTSAKGIVCLIVEGKSCIRLSKILCGPSSSIVPFEDMPNACLKKKYGTCAMRNAVHTPSENNIDREINLFFSEENFSGENGILLIKKDALSGDDLNNLRDYLHDYGFNVLEEKIISVDEDTLRSMFEEPIMVVPSVGPHTQYVIITLSRVNCVTCLHYLIGGKSTKESKLKRPNSIRSIFSLDKNDIIFVKDKKKINNLIRQYFLFEKYNESITVDMVKNFLYRKNVTSCEKEEENIKLREVFLECFTKMCESKPSEQTAIVWLSEWFKQKKGEIMADVMRKEMGRKMGHAHVYPLGGKDKTLIADAREEEKVKQSSNIPIGSSRGNAGGGTKGEGPNQISIFQKACKGNKKIFIIPDIYDGENNTQISRDNDEVMLKLIKHLERLGYINLSFIDLCMKEEKKKSLLGKKIEYTKRKYNMLTVDLVRRILKENLDRNKSYSNYVLTGFYGVIDLAYLTREDIIPTSFCLLVLKEDANVESEKIGSGEGELGKRGRGAHLDSFLSLLHGGEKNLIDHFLNKGKILIYRKGKNFFNNFLQNLETEIVILLGVNLNHLKSEIKFLVECYNYLFVDHVKLFNEEKRKKKQGKICEDELDCSSAPSDLLLSFLIERLNSLKDKDYRKFVLCNFPLNMQQVDAIKGKTNAKVVVFHFNCKVGENSVHSEWKETQRGLLELGNNRNGGRYKKGAHYKVDDSFVLGEVARLSKGVIVHQFDVNNKAEKLSSGVHHLFDLISAVRRKVILISNLTLKNVDFIGLYLQYEYPRVVFCDLNFMSEGEGSKDYTNSLWHMIDGVFDENNTSGKNKERVNEIIRKMNNFVSRLNASYFVFGGFPSDLEIEDFRKLELFFDIKLCILVVPVRGDSGMGIGVYRDEKPKSADLLSPVHILPPLDLFDAASAEASPLADTVLWFSSRGNLLTVEAGSQGGEYQGAINSVGGEADEKAITTGDSSGENILPTDNPTESIQQDDQLEDEEKKEILKKVEDRIRPNLICYQAPDKYDVREFVKRKIGRDSNGGSFHCLFCEDVLKELPFIIEEKSEGYIKKLAEKIKTEKENTIREIYVTYLEGLVKHSSKYLFANIVLCDVPLWTGEGNDTCVDTFGRFTNFKKVIQLVHSVQGDNVFGGDASEFHGANTCAALNDDRVFGASSPGGSNALGSSLEGAEMRDNADEAGNHNNEVDKADDKVDKADKEELNSGGKPKGRSKHADKLSKYNKAARDLRDIISKKHADVEVATIYLNRDMPRNTDSLFCPQIIILFVPQNEKLQLLLSSLLCFHLKNFSSINMAQVVREEMVKEQIRRGVAGSEVEKLEKGGVRGGCHNDGNSDHHSYEKYIVDRAFTSLLDQIKRADKNVLVTGFPIVQNKYSKSDYFEQFRLFKPFTISGIISISFEDTYLHTLVGHAIPDGAHYVAKYEEVIQTIKLEFGCKGKDKNKLYFAKITNKEDLQRVLGEVTEVFSC
ncbi:nucleoside diphosphate kinase, putative [Plasmodium knowlesi strain H]|uniref:Nucleoside diphosphate kinase, putative n=3 Tax=Plasmodium knowlesi TaxID=5850 RepID=A0A5K1V719_PLAKH|nr:nucleoside diphosphate kinase, putative [Plasmodium knowlesi strain H]OTN64459.1 putative Nucleoside diphosphate kinase [Plasmodium knowlesi]CAA9989276.1 nucleoside diphosphate kinase, putative [Plasmodium knowlesi strain H]SBO26148.1 nucleoside diphosphate kinase, putative [Plasmodium knowlesi strain H]SBO26860.1 nucleoside diphosphate kinase, putative [Plasmodium knowlesi strain H]VVS78750.1 nucleoside diphosphate kinase, putative [Plasmodium knowlesi strain H]|eukprot:XP_002261622.1 nucleoside diphosphate kinase, putative [Plasmodium knowlesi strain H]